MGVAAYERARTGCTVLRFDGAKPMAVDRRGGAVGFVGDYGAVEAICLAGGSLYGLEAAAGAAAALWEERQHSWSFLDIALVSGGIIFDFARRAGGGHDTAAYPDKALGRAATEAALPLSVPVGATGAGTSAGVGAGFDYAGSEPGGQGAAFGRLRGAGVLVVTVVNAMGAIHGRDGRVVRGMRTASGSRSSYADDLRRRVDEGEPLSPQRGNTTLTVVVTDAALSGHALTQLGRQVHASMARAIQPFHTMDDGDVLWTVSTGVREGTDIPPTALGVHAGELAWDAVLRAVDA